MAVFVYLMTLAFSYEELFGATPDEELIKLTEQEINQIKAKVSKKKLESC